MSPPEPPGGSLTKRADTLASEGRWRELAELLGPADEVTGTTDRVLAYRYGEALYHTGRMEELAAYAAAFDRASRAQADPLGTMRALNLSGIAAFELGRIPEARDRFDDLMDLAEAERNDDMLARSANNLGAIANLRGRRHEALAYYQLAIPLYQRLDRVQGLAQTHHNLGLSYRDLDLLEDAAAAFRRAVELAEEIDDRSIVAMATVGRAEIQLRRGDAELARALVEVGLRHAREVEDPISEAEACRVLGLVLTATEGSSEEAAAAFQAGLELANKTSHPMLEAEIQRDMGRALEAAGRSAEAEALLRSALDRFERLGASAEAELIRSRLEASD